MKRAPLTASARRPWSAGKVLDLLLAALAHLAVLGSWLALSLSVMGSLALGRRILMNSEWAWDWGRLPQPWVAPIAIVAIVLSHLLFGWTMRRFSGGVAAYGPSVIAWAGVTLGAVYAAYVWAPPVQVGEQVGPTSGQSTRWGIPAYAAYYARLWLPGAIIAVTAVLIFFGRQSPLRAWLRALDAGRLRRRNRRASGRQPVEVS